jgi:uncharacterized protein YciI
MFVVTLTYTAPIDAVDALVDAHRAWLRKGIADGVLLAAGRQVPRTGGVLLAVGTRDAVEAFAAADPFVTGGVATFALTEVDVVLAAPGFEALRG